MNERLTALYHCGENCNSKVAPEDRSKQVVMGHRRGYVFELGLKGVGVDWIGFQDGKHD